MSSHDAFRHLVGVALVAVAGGADVAGQIEAAPLLDGVRGFVRGSEKRRLRAERW
ncbi:MAG TPA: hypothetical protein VJZ76_19435 [Thermoanaerobaculia bacterium]|nr:hypothetical protein [Thermoanaerobaculia bacterium]